MNLLLDTHAFVWTILSPKRLSSSSREALTDPANDVFVSAVSLWEISIKAKLGKLDLVNLTIDDLLQSAIKMGFSPISLMPDEAATQGEMKENTHFDPFDRMLIWQAICRQMVLVSRDQAFSRFKKDGLKLLWK